jgi:lysophospholipase L1-like esterase
VIVSTFRASASRLRARDFAGRAALAACLAAVALVAAALSPSRASAACGGTLTSQARTHPKGQLPPLALGDSTMILSLPGLASAGYDANAHGCRQFFQALALMSALRSAGRLPHMVTLALGANGTVSAAQIEQALRIMCCNRLLVLVTPRELGGGSGSDAAIERVEAKRHPGRILLLDWVAYSQGHSSWFAPDGLHLGPAGVAGFTSLLARAMPYAYVPCPPAAVTGGRRRARPARARERRAVTPIPPSLTLTTTLARKGYIGATITGAPGAYVQLTQQLSSRTTSLATVLIPASGTVAVPQATEWMCAPLVRELSASTLPPAAPASSSVTVTTPSCARRLSARIGRSSRPGAGIAVWLGDRWKIGRLPLRICVTAPGATPACSRWHLHADQRSRKVELPDPRPGGWQVTVGTAYHQQFRRTVWVEHGSGRLRLYAAGDSEMQILDTDIAQDVAHNRVAVSSDARISTGLTSSLFNWQAEARSRASALKPDVSVVIIGANDGFDVAGPGGRRVGCCGPDWSAGYANLVAEMMRTLLRGQAGRVYWVVLPAPSPANFHSVFDAVNAGIRQAASRFPGRVGLIDANAFFTPGDVYRNYMTYHGRGFVIHEADGIHLSASADVVLAQLIKQRLIADHVIR